MFYIYQIYMALSTIGLLTKITADMMTNGLFFIYSVSMPLVSIIFFIISIIKARKMHISYKVINIINFLALLISFLIRMKIV